MPFRIALSGLNAASADLKTTGNNIANASTVGFKSSRTEFVDVFSVGFGGISKTAIGGGVELSSVTQQFSQGNIEFTNNNLDLGINGQGFFVLSDQGSTVYSRAGSFRLDREGFVVDSAENRLQVYPAATTATGTTFDTGNLSDLQLLTAAGPPAASTTVSILANLNATDTPPVTPFNPAAPTPDMYSASTSITLFDSQGSEHTGTTYFVKTAATNTWEAYLSIDGSPVTTGAPAAFETLVFDGSGNLVTPAAGTVAYSPFAVSGGADPLSLTYDFGGATQYGSPFAINSLNQDGFASGRLSGIDIDASGVVSARFTNGQSTIMGKVALADFNNPQGLSPQGNTAWADTFAAGDRRLGEAGGASFGLIQSGALESSNVDIAGELVNLITAQRNFQANAQVISTADTVTQTIINIR